jgi:ABC-type nitrate/sulfonate/bicarbonate transport system permease component
MLLGIALGVFMGVNNYSQRFFTPYVVIGLSIPAIAWAAVTTIVYGFSIMAPVIATVLTTFPYVAINVWKGVENLESDLIDMSKSFNISRGRMLRRLIIPSAAPFLFSSFRFGLAISWKIVTIAEIFAASSGIGYKLMQAYQLYRFEEAWAWASLFIIVILAIEYGIIKPIERRVFEYRHDADFALIG